MEDKPKWFTIGNDLLWPLVGIGLATIEEQRFSNTDLRSLPYLALCHHAGCLETSISANKRGKHASAICLVRQSVEALTVAEIGLQIPELATPCLMDWKEGRKSQGDLRKFLEQHVWPRYGKGLWDETWSEFYRNLARAVQPYAHYTPELQGWQFITLDYQGGEKFLGAFGLETYDSLQATRVTLFHMLLTWMLGRILLAHGSNKGMEHESKIHELGQALSASKLLFPQKEWWVQLAPHMLFKKGYNWREESN